MRLAGRGLAERLQRPDSARHLALVRIAVGVHVLTVFMSPAPQLILELPGHRMPWAETLFPRAVEELVLQHLDALLILGVASMALATIGLLTRIAMPIAALCFLLTQNFWFRMSLFHDDWLYFNAYLLVLSCSPCADAWSVDAWLRRRAGEPARGNPRQYRLAIELMILWFAGVYVAAGLAKIFPLVKLPLWLGGARAQSFAQQFLYDSPIYWLTGGPAFDYFHVRWPFALAAVFTLFAELGAALLVLTDRHRPLMLAAIVGMHTGIFLLGIPGFVQGAIASIALFVPATALEPSGSTTIPRATSPPCPRSSGC
ncbi:MAG: hypothetical protein PVI30_19130 [Myxococcales bacterium]|jgi:hypothetical protein